MRKNYFLLHVLICEFPSEEKNVFEAVGIGGVVNFIVPELNDLYSGWITNQDWRKRCHMLVKDSRDTYLVIIKKFKNYCESNDIHIGERLLRVLMKNTDCGHQKKIFDL